MTTLPIRAACFSQTKKKVKVPLPGFLTESDTEEEVIVRIDQQEFA